VAPEILNTVFRVSGVGCAPLAARYLEGVAADEGGVDAEVAWVCVWDVDSGVCGGVVGKEGGQVAGV
jgi:hypothetical protein